MGKHRFRIEIIAIGENGEEIESTVEKTGDSKPEIREEYKNSIESIVDYWNINIKRIEKINSS